MEEIEIIKKNAQLFSNIQNERQGIQLLMLKIDSQNRFMWSKDQRDEKGKKQVVPLTPTSPTSNSPASKSDTITTIQYDQTLNSAIKKILKSSVVFFDFSNTLITDMAFLKSTKYFEKVTTMSLSNTGLEKVPKALRNIPKTLRYLDLSYNNLSKIPKSIKWYKIHGINISHNSFTKWPETIKPTNFPELQELFASWNNFSSDIPENMEFTTLQSLDLSFCNLFLFPAFVTHSTSLRMLDISGNPQLSNLAISTFETFNVLRYLNISGVPCNIDMTPKSLAPDIIIAHGCPNIAFPQNSNTTIYAD